MTKQGFLIINKYYNKFLKKSKLSNLKINLFLTFTFNYNNFRILPHSGDLVIVKFFYKCSSLRSTFFKYNLGFGICISRFFAKLNSFFIIRNSYKRTAFELTFFLYSPLIQSIKFFSNRRKFYKRSNLNFLRIKKIALSHVLF